MNQLLRGLLAKDPALRLTADDALKLPVFDDFRGTVLPLLENSPKAYHLEGMMDTIFEEDLVHAGSIQSLESRSRAFWNQDDNGSRSNFSVRYEGKPHQFPKNQNFQGQENRNFHFFNSGKGSSSIGSSSQLSFRDEISPLTSPQLQVRYLSNSKSIQMSPLVGYSQATAKANHHKVLTKADTLSESGKN